ncbi:Phosphoglycolate phosphatase [Aquisphaera giovannonii]|uniref:phosphoglycolate phosphatase n=1 Tax=Aquisphaera giovannonii TaxID=406548 RepID=A0A5B9WD60_9BACT|nr:HAD family hydrolase [Aquisphaera giovannonii]QEH38608.1 Phosphoglycolate phosphatase [Aquisphaera giovannonii]
MAEPRDAALAVLFDLDGTLLDTLEDLGRSVNEVLEGHGFPPHPMDAYRRFIGDGVAMLVERALPAEAVRADPSLVPRCVEGFREAYGRGWDVASGPYPGIPELLDALVARGIPMAVLSNKPHPFTRRCVEELLPRWRFAAVLGDRPGFARKPDPGEALRIAADLGVEPGRVAYLGDSSIDMETARGAGMIALGAGWGFRGASELLAHGAVAALSRPIELLGWVDRGGAVEG